MLTVLLMLQRFFFFFFFFNDTATTEIYTLSLHDALPIWPSFLSSRRWTHPHEHLAAAILVPGRGGDRRSSHAASRLETHPRGSPHCRRRRPLRDLQTSRPCLHPDHI